jgi:hypothetical protein
VIVRRLDRRDLEAPPDEATRIEGREELSEGLEREDHRLVAGDVDVDALPRGAGLEDRAETADRGEGRCDVFAESTACGDGLFAGDAAGVGGADLGLQRELVGDPLAPRPAAPEMRQRKQREASIDRLQRIEPEAHRLDPTGTEVLDEQLRADE